MSIISLSYSIYAMSTTSHYTSLGVSRSLKAVIISDVAIDTAVLLWLLMCKSVDTVIDIHIKYNYVAYLLYIPMLIAISISAGRLHMT